MKRKGILIIAFVLALAFPLHARLGGSGIVSLGMGDGVRAIGMGGAFTAYGEGVEAGFWNPAGIAGVKQVSILTAHAMSYVGTSVENISFALPMNNSALGMDIHAFLSGPIEITTVNRQEGINQYYSANDFVIGFMYGKQMTNKFWAGTNVKAVYSTIDQVSALGFAIDIGGKYYTGIKGLNFGFAIQNFGPDERYTGQAIEWYTSKDTLQDEDVQIEAVTQAFPLPLSFQGGLSFTAIKNDNFELNLALDYIHPIDQFTKKSSLSDSTGSINWNGNDMGKRDEYYYFLKDVNAGIEMKFMNRFFLRLGHTEKNDRLFTAGLGIDMGKYRIDYSFEYHKYLNGIHRLGIVLGQ